LAPSLLPVWTADATTVAAVPSNIDNTD